MKRVILVSVVFLLLLTPAFCANESKLYAEQTVLHDTKGHWAERAIATAVAKGYVKGYDDGSFRPDKSVTRAEFIKMAVEALGLDVAAVKQGEKWYIPYVVSAKQNGVMADVDLKGDFGKPLTRFEMAKIALRASQENGKSIVFDNKAVMYQATKLGIITGLGKGELGKDKTTTRAQAIAIIERILTVRGGGTLKADKYAVANAEIEFHKTNIFTVMPEILGEPMNPKKPWDVANTIIESRDGLYKGELVRLVAIDLEDPNDPNLKLLPPLNELKWAANVGNDIDPSIVNSKKSYLLYFDTKVHYAKNNERYDTSSKEVPINVWGFEENYEAAKNNKLSSATLVYKKTKGDLPVFIIPKTGFKQYSSIDISINIPAGSQFYGKVQTVYSAKGPKYPENR